jgi:type I restriction enzyme M protein
MEASPVDRGQARAELRDHRHLHRELNALARGSYDETERQLDRAEALLSGSPGAWQRVRLGDVCEILSGPSGAMIPRLKSDGGTPVIKPRNIVNNQISPDGVDRVDAAAAERLAEYRVRVGDVVCVRSGVLARQALVTEETANWIFGTQCIILRPNQTIDARYLTYYLSHPHPVRWLLGHASGSTVQSLTTRTLSDLPILLPAMERQQEIGHILRTLDEQRSVHDRIQRGASELRDILTSLLPPALPATGSQ